MEMSEDFLQYIWSQRLYDSAIQKTTDGVEVEILNPGRLNVDSGPDFFNAQIRVGGVTWAGNVEIHLTSDDWFHHGHESDPAYNNVILHVVGHSTGRKIVNQLGDTIPEVELSYSKAIKDNYVELSENHEKGPVRCYKHLDVVPSVVRSSWLDALLVERMETKCSRTLTLLETFKGDSDQVFFCLLARTMGGKVNGDPMEMMARQTPLKILIGCQSVIQAEALLLGQAGILDNTLEGREDDDYVRRLREEYEYLKHEFKLSSVAASVWKYARLRPQNFPDVRLVQLASIIRSMPGDFEGSLQQSQSIDKLLNVAPSEYWQTHFRLGVLSRSKSDKRVGSMTRRSVAINAIVPFLLACAHRRSDVEAQDSAIALLRTLDVEDNATLRLWTELGIEPHDEGDAQALLHLTTEYCERGRCLDCRFGHHVVSRGLRVGSVVITKSPFPFLSD